jgi:16S rRNA (cytosine1402-N4)-methyltransferase
MEVCEQSEGGHQPVLLDEVIQRMEPKAGERYVDATFGGGGHTRALLEVDASIEVIAFDRDPDAQLRARSLSELFGERFQLHSRNFSEISNLAPQTFDAVLFDFGLSSFQLDTANRGFSFREDAPLDMRMNPRAGQSAADFLENASEFELIRAVRQYGEEKRWRRVVAAIIQARGSGQLLRTHSFAHLVSDAVGPQPYGRQLRHPATRTFQGVRIAVNDELVAIEKALPAAFDRLIPGGRLVAISFHSLEDRIVKRFCRRMAGRPEHARDSSLQDERQVRAELTVTAAIKPTAKELAANPRSRSARMRVIRKI